MCCLKKPQKQDRDVCPGVISPPGYGIDRLCTDGCASSIVAGAPSPDYNDPWDRRYSPAYRPCPIITGECEKSAPKKHITTDNENRSGE